MLHPPRSSEPIPGYVVQERIGVGGYGEVWSARAPGDLTKAIKFVYGYFDDARVARELKALERIKQVRHPFLLSLERYEVVDGQLVIVTELADMSLKDRFEQARESGGEGIGRDELIGYLRDAADALDYMSDNFSLQHLDVKPENLLLVGGRVKVADFGLVKDLHEATAASMMGGLTPIYAAPEVFDDRPSQRSDQYSLAIVYQEMLCGNLPFPGRTPAQLATQHLHARPRLATLPAADQVVIAQALAKSPAERFASCQALIDALCEADGAISGRRATSERTGPPATVSDTTSVKALAAGTDTDSPDARSGNVKTHILGGYRDHGHVESGLAVDGLAPAAEPIAELPPIDVDGLTSELRPTLFLGIGGTAGKTLAGLRRRLADRFGDAPIPSMRMLLVDTDVKSLAAATSADRETTLAGDQTMPLALRSARDYTANSRNMMQWLSRRWLYNIPRSLQTEGRRPLGRLALVDHADAWVARLRALLTEITSPEAVAASVQRTGSTFQSGPPRVFVIASVSGGTGGGMVLDVAYAVRQILTELGHATDGVCEILAHSTGRNPTAAELATANAYACLTELENYARFGYQPGEPACGLPSYAGDRRELTGAYFVHLGDSLSEEEFAAATDVLASYLYLNSATSAAAAFDECRLQPPDVDEEGTPLRSFWLTTIGCTHTSLPPEAAELLCRGIVDGWRGKHAANAAVGPSLVDIALGRNGAPPATASSAIAEVASRHAAELELAVDALREKVTPLVAHQLGGDAEAVFARLRAMDETQHGEESSRTQRLVEVIRSLFDPTAVTDGTPKPPAVELHAALEQAVKPIAAPKGRAITQWILHFVDDPAARIAVASQAKDWYAGHLRDLEAECAQALTDTQHQLQALEQTVIESEKAAHSRSRMFGARRAKQKHRDQVDGVLLLIVGLRVAECTLHGVSRLVRLIGAGVFAAGDALKDLQHDLGQLSRGFAGPAPWQDDDPAAASPDEQVRAAAVQGLRAAMDDMLQNVNARFENEFLLPHGGLRSVCEKGDSLRKSMVDTLRAMARAEVLGALKQIAIDDSVWGAGTTPDERHAGLETCLSSARAKFTDCGGAQRLLAIVPAGSTLKDSLSGMLAPPPTVVVDSDAELVLCHEQQQLSLAHVAARLIDGRNDIMQIAGRLHTRMDVPWSKLPQMAHRAVAEGAPS